MRRLVICSAIVIGLGATINCDAQLRALEDFEPANAEVFRVQQKVEHLYEQGHYKRAYSIYLNELAPVGDKFAQYMIGFMHHHGKFVEQDTVRASAWYRLAAERQNSDFEIVRNEVLSHLSDAELARSDELYVDLRRQYADVVLLLERIRSDLDNAGASSPADLRMSGEMSITVIPDAGIVASTNQLKRRARNRIEARLRVIDSYLADTRVETDVDKLSLSTLEKQIEEFVSEVSDR